MEGLPVTIRLLDPPLHEFLPHPARPGAAGSAIRARAEALQESNPMLGMRGVRLGIVHPEIYAMQVRAIAMAMRDFYETWRAWPAVEVMIPLVAYESELEQAARAGRARDGRGRAAARASTTRSAR